MATRLPLETQTLHAELLEDRPGDLSLAWTALVDRGARWRKAAERGLAAFEEPAPSLHKQLKAAL